MAISSYMMTADAIVPDVYVKDKFPTESKTIKVAYSDVFSTDLNGENVRMRIIYAKIDRNLPSLLFEIISSESKPYKDFYKYLEKLTSVIDKIKVTGRSICDITLESKGQDLWMLGAKYAVAGSSLFLVRHTFDDLSPDREQCMAISLPLTMMDSSKFNWNGKNHQKEFLDVLSEGKYQDIEFKFYMPDTNERVAASLPLNSDIALTIQKLLKAYK